MGNRSLDGGGQFRLVHHLADKIPVAFLGGYAPGRGMGLAQVAHLGQCSHLITNRGRGQSNSIVFHQPLRTDWLSSFNIITDNE